MSRRWLSDEVSLLVDLISKDYDFLTSSLSATKTKFMVDEKWKAIANQINDLNNDANYPVEKVKRKWFDLKSISKKAVAFYKKELRKTGGGTSKADVPTDLQFKIAEIIGDVCIEGVPGSQMCDTGAALSSANADEIEATTDEKNVSADSSPPPAAKRRKTSLGSKEQINKELLDSQKMLLSTVAEIRDELKNLTKEVGNLTKTLALLVPKSRDKQCDLTMEHSDQPPVEGFFTNLLGSEFSVS